MSGHGGGVTGAVDVREVAAHGRGPAQSRQAAGAGGTDAADRHAEASADGAVAQRRFSREQHQQITLESGQLGQAFADEPGRFGAQQLTVDALAFPPRCGDQIDRDRRGVPAGDPQTLPPGRRADPFRERARLPDTIELLVEAQPHDLRDVVRLRAVEAEVVCGSPDERPEPPTSTSQSRRFTSSRGFTRSNTSSR